MRRLLSKLAHPFATLALLIILLADTWLVSQPQVLGGFSTAGLFIREQILHERPASVRSFSPPRTVLVRQASGEFAIFHPDNDSTWDKVHDAYTQHPGQVIDFYWRPVRLDQGFWAPTTRTDRHTIKVSDGNSLSPEQRAAARRLFIEQSGAAAWLSRADVQTLTTTDIDRTRTLYLGFLHNAAAIVVAILFLASLAWVPKTRSYLRARIGEHRLARGVCPRCSYNLHGLREPTCPECGTPLSRPAPPQPSGSGVQ